MIGYITGLRALLSAQVGLRTTGNNTANSATVGYSRQRVLFAASPMIEVGPRLRVGTGVDVSGINSVTDPLLEGRIRTQERALGRFDVLSLSYSEIESSFQEPSEAGLAARFADFFSSLTSLTSSPQDTQRRAALVNEGLATTERFHLLSSQTEAYATGIADQVESKILEINRLAEQVAVLNQQTVEQGPQGGALEARDERNRILKELNRLVDADVIEQPNGSVNVLVSGQLLVASERARALDFTQLTNEDFRVSFADSGEEVAIRDGELRGLFDFAKDVLPDLRGRLDELAQNLIFEFNRVHSTGVPRDGSFSSLTSTYPVTTDIGPPALVPLSQTNLPFPPEASDLRISVVNESTGEIEQTTISIDPETQSLTNVATLLSSVANIEASVDGVGILHIQAAEGYTFDFSSRLDPDPDTIGSFGGTTATIGGTNGGPFALADGDELQIEVDGGVAQTVTFNTGDFADIAAATAEEVVAAIQAQTSGVSASIVGGRVVLQSLTDGSTGSLQLTNVTNDPLGTIGLSAVLETGTDDPPVEVRASGTYSGEGARNLRFVASGNGEIGVTPGLTVDVYDEDGSLLRTLSVGDGYVPGSELSVSDGIQISFGEGAISADAGDTFEVRAVSDSDTGDFLAALGINAFFTGENAANIDVVQAIQDDPTLIAGGLSGSPGDNENFLKLLSLQEEKIGSLRGETIEGFYGNLVADVGSDGLRSLQFFESQTVLTEFLAQQRDSVSGVSLDEEAVNLLQFQRSFEAAARYISVVDSTMLEVLSLVR